VDDEQQAQSRTIWGPKGDRIIQGVVYAAFAVFLVFVAGTLLIQGVGWAGDALAYEASWSWWWNAYLMVGCVLGVIAAIVAFCWLWFWSVTEGRFWGFAIGWIPSGIAAAVLLVATIFLWGIAVLAWLIFLQDR
jgi:hypothetical protein